MSPPETAYLIDASPYIFRAFYSLPASMKSPAGEPVGAVYGFASFLAKLVEEEAPSHLAVTFDGSLTTSFRNEIYPAYKAQRELPPPELTAQLSACYEVAAAFGAPTYIDERFEADDLIGTLCHGLSREGHRALVVTGDKDFAQLVDERVGLYDFAKGMRLGPPEVVAKFGVSPGQIPDLLGLAGDSVDNIPGVPGVGAKTAAALLAHFGSLDELFARLPEVEGLPLRGARGLAAKLAAGRESAFLSRRLATIATDAPVRADLGRLRFGGADRARLEPLLARLGFSGLRQRLLG
jgi:5'-3' exonuclease